MSITVDLVALTRRCRWWRRLGFGGVDVLVRLVDVPTQTCVALVSAALSRIDAMAVDWDGNRSPYTVYGTHRGALVQLGGEREWRDLVGELADALRETGHDGTISAPEAMPDEVMPAVREAPPCPSLTALLTIDPPLREGPFNVMGVPEARWGVPARATQEALALAATFVSEGEGDWRVYQGAYPIDVSAVEAREVFEASLTLDGPPLAALARLGRRPPTARLGTHAVALQQWGATQWTVATPENGHVEVARRLIEMAVALAPHVDLAFIRPRFPAQFNGVYERAGSPRVRSLMNECVPEANGAQVVTGAHLAKAHDLGDWQVTEVADDRYLITAPDLSKWYRPMTMSGWATDEYAATHLIAKARQDFGEMVLPASV